MGLYSPRSQHSFYVIGSVFSKDVVEYIRTGVYMKRIILSLILLIPCPVFGTLLAHYKMNDDAASDTVTDDQGSHSGVYKDKDGSINTSTGSVSGKVSQALDLDGPQGGGGTDEYIEITDHADFSPLSAFSVSLWVYMDEATDFPMASKGVIVVDGEWFLGTDSSDYLKFIIIDESADAYIGRMYSTSISAGQWYHIVGTYDGGDTSASCKIYLDSVQRDNVNDENEASSFDSAENLESQVYLGKHSIDYGDGQIDMVRFYDEALGQSDVNDLYNDGDGTEGGGGTTTYLLAKCWWL